MKVNINTAILYTLFFTFTCIGCAKDGAPGQDGLDGLDGKDGKDANVYTSSWITPTAWSGMTGDWYFDVNDANLTKDIVENGVILAYCSLKGDLYQGTTMRALPAYAVNANWSFLIHNYNQIQFTCDMPDQPATLGNQFRFIIIPANYTSASSSSSALKSKRVYDLKSMSYKDVCKLLNIAE